MRYEFHPQARAEYLEAIAYYEERRTGLGARFALEIEGVIQRIIDGEIRRCLAQKFPYGVLYSAEKSYVLVLAVMHHSREPEYWRDRTE